MQKTVRNFLEKYRIPAGARFIVAVSGGPDSVCLLHIFKYMNLPLLALHCNFGLRDKESDKDEQFVKRFCDTYGIALHIKKFSTSEYARKQGISIEMAARELRYAWFREMKEKKNMDYIVTGHHADDLAETVFINLCRGTGIRGLGGIKPVNGDLLRPLLECSRADILTYLGQHHLGYRTDSTNDSLDFVRNKIRHRILPVCKEINPGFLRTMRENCEVMKEVEALYRYALKQLRENIVSRSGDEWRIDIRKTLSSPAPYALLYELLMPYGFNKSQVKDLLAGPEASSGKRFLSENYELVKDRAYWHLYPRKAEHISEISIPGPGDYRVSGRIYRFELLPYENNTPLSRDPLQATLDAGKIRFPLKIRNWETGDRFCPLGMKRLQKKLSDFFVDRKFTDKQKKECLLLLSEERIAWVIGHRIDERFKITPFTTHILKITPVKE